MRGALEAEGFNIDAVVVESFNKEPPKSIIKRVVIPETGILPRSSVKTPRVGPPVKTKVVKVGRSFVFKIVTFLLTCLNCTEKKSRLDL